METKEKPNPFKRAVKYAAKLRLSIAGPSGSGKTYTALQIAKALGGKAALLDTEHGSASKYADQFKFDTLELDSFHPDYYVRAIQAAEQAGYDILVIDSLSHAWSGKGGLLEVVDQIAARNRTANTFSAWKDATPIQNRMVDAMLSAKLHLIATLRSKTEYIVEKDDKGRMIPRKVGMAPVQRDGIEYEFDVFTEMDQENRMLVQKTRCPALTGKVFPKPGPEVAKILLAWLEGEAKAEPEPEVKAEAEPHVGKPKAKSNGEKPMNSDQRRIIEDLLAMPGVDTIRCQPKGGHPERALVSWLQDLLDKGATESVAARFITHAQEGLSAIEPDEFTATDEDVPF